MFQCGLPCKKNKDKINNLSPSHLIGNYKCRSKLISLFSDSKNDCNGGIWQSGISKSQVEYVQRHACFVNVQSSLFEKVIFSVCARMCNAAYVIFIMWNSISGLDPWYHFRYISCGVAVTVRSHQKKYQVNC